MIARRRQRPRGRILTNETRETLVHVAMVVLGLVALALLRHAAARLGLLD